jgi:hypothetical protein
MLLESALLNFFAIIIASFCSCVCGFFGILLLLTPKEVLDYGRSDGLAIKGSAWVIVPKGWTHPADENWRIKLICEQKFFRPLFFFFFWLFVISCILAVYKLENFLNIYLRVSS